MISRVRVLKGGDFSGKTLIGGLGFSLVFCINGGRKARGLS